MGILVKQNRTFSIWKYSIEGKISKIDVPANSRIVHVDKQRVPNNDHEAIRIWMAVDPAEAKTETRVFHKYLTGTWNQCENPLRHIGTVLMYNGTFVAHVFEEIL